MKIRDVFFLLFATTQLIAQQQRKIEETLPTRQVHLDFHTSELIPNIGAQFDKKQFQSALLEGNINQINIFILNLDSAT